MENPGVSIDDNIYANRFTEEEMGHRIELWQALCKHWVPKLIPAESRTLDLGAGYCEFINNVASARKWAIDRDPELPKHASEEVTYIVAELEDGLKQLEDGAVDRIMASNIFEHLPNREVLFRNLREAHRVLAPDGKIIVMQPNIAAVKERFYDFVDHSLPLTEKGMAESLRACGFRIEQLKARFLPYTTKSRYPPWPFLVRLYLLFPIVHHFMGGQMLIVAGKPEGDGESQPEGSSSSSG